MLTILSNLLTQYSLFLCFIRWGTILLIAIFWPALINQVGQRYLLSKEIIAQWQAERFRIAIWLILFELLVPENSIIKLFQLI